MQIKITVDIENTDILKFFELFKKDLATVAKNTTVETVEQPKNESADFSEEKQKNSLKNSRKSRLKTTVPILAEYSNRKKPQKKNQTAQIIPWSMNLTLMRLQLTLRLKLLKTYLYQWLKVAEKPRQKKF